MILARHAEALFWAGRQLERAESTTRALDVVGRNAMHHRHPRARSEWRSLLDVFGLAAMFDALPHVRDVDQDTVAEFLFASPDNPGSVVASVAQLRENLRTVRDRVPVELWEEANRLHLQLHAQDALDPLQAAPFELFSSVRRGCQAMAGVAAEAMARDEGYSFVDMGRMLERSIITCRIIRFGLLGDSPDFDASTVLRLASSLQAYRRFAGYHDDPETLASFLLATEDLPRSVLACQRRV
ncbi:MAG: alpha-E domain-containing protein, partial [Acidimicrobiales bacterium]